MGKYDEIIKRYDGCWKDICCYESLSEELIREFKDRL